MKTHWPACPACEADYESIDAFEHTNSVWQTDRCEKCGAVYQIIFTDDLAFETRPMLCDRTLPLFPVDHQGQEL